MEKPLSRPFRGALLLALLLSSCAGGPPATESGAPARKSALVGELLAFFPGFFVHGMGHRYAGNHDRANDILALELYSFLGIGLGGILYGIGRSEDAEAVEIAGLVGMGIGAIPFLGTWIYDLVYTPSEVDRYNSRLGEAK
jgi:hypothetical protein